MKSWSFSTKVIDSLLHMSLLVKYGLQKFQKCFTFFSFFFELDYDVSWNFLMIDIAIKRILLAFF